MHQVITMCVLPLKAGNKQFDHIGLACFSAFLKKKAYTSHIVSQNFSGMKYFKLLWLELVIFDRLFNAVMLFGTSDLFGRIIQFFGLVVVQVYRSRVTTIRLLFIWLAMDVSVCYYQKELGIAVMILTDLCKFRVCQPVTYIVSNISYDKTLTNVQ